MDRRCTDCDASLPAAARFCPRCGAVLGRSTTPAPDMTPPAATAPDATPSAAPDATPPADAAPAADAADPAGAGSTGAAATGPPTAPPGTQRSGTAQPTSPTTSPAPGAARRVGRPVAGVVAVAALVALVAAALTSGPLPPDDTDGLAALDGSSTAAAELGAGTEGRAGPDGRRPPARTTAGAPRCEPTGCELWRATLRSSGVPVATTDDRVAYLDGTRLVVREVERGRPAATRDLATVLRTAPDPADTPTDGTTDTGETDARPTDDDQDPPTLASPGTATIEARLDALEAALEAEAPRALALRDGTIAASVGPIVTVLDPGGEPRWARVLEADVRELRLAGDALVVVTATTDDATDTDAADTDTDTTDPTARLATYDLEVGTERRTNDVDLLRLDAEVAVLHRDGAVVAVDLTTGEERWMRPLAPGQRARTEAGLLLVPVDDDTEVVAADGTTLRRVEGVVAAAVPVAEGTVLLTRSAMRDDDARGGSSGAPVRGAVLLLEPSGDVRWSSSLGELAIDAGVDGEALRAAQLADTVTCCPRLFPSVSPAGVLLEILDDVAVVVGLRDGASVAVGDPDALQRELFFTTVSSIGDLEAQRSGNRWELGGVGAEGRVAVTLLDARRIPSADPLVVVGERSLVVVRPVPSDG